MQRVNNPHYVYDALGRLVNYTPSGATNDVVAQHVLLDPRIPGPRSLKAGGLKPVQPVETEVIYNMPTNDVTIRKKVNPSLYVPPLSLTSPPVTRPKTVASELGYANVASPELHDIYGITTSTPILTIPHDTASKRAVR